MMYGSPLVRLPKLYNPNEPVVAVRLAPCESVRITTAFLSAVPFGVKTLPEIVTGLAMTLT